MSIIDWTPALDSKLLGWRAQKPPMSWAYCARMLDCLPTVALNRHRQLVRVANGKTGKTRAPGRRFTQAEDDRLVHLKAGRDLTWAQIAAEMGRASEVCRTRYHKLIDPTPAEGREAKPPTFGEWPSDATFDGPRDHPKALAEYARFTPDRRYSVTPPVGFSCVGTAAQMCLS